MSGILYRRCQKLFNSSRLFFFHLLNLNVSMFLPSVSIFPWEPTEKSQTIFSRILENCIVAWIVTSVSYNNRYLDLSNNERLSLRNFHTSWTFLCESWKARGRALFPRLRALTRPAGRCQSCGTVHREALAGGSRVRMRSFRGQICHVNVWTGKEFAHSSRRKWKTCVGVNIFFYNTFIINLFLS